MNHWKNYLGAVLVAWTIVAANPARAVSIVVPNNLATNEASNNNTFPFDIADSSVSSQRYQQVYGSGDFSAIPGGGYITQILFRPDAGVHGSAFTSTLSYVFIQLSTTSAGPDGLSTTYANNIGADAATVYSGSLALSSADTGPANGPKDFDIVINLKTPFFYNPARGNLLMDVWNYDGGSSTYFDAVWTSGDAVSRVYTFLGYNATSGSTDSAGLVTKFTIVPPLLSFNPSSTDLMLSWTTNAAGWHLQTTTNPANGWSNFSGSTQTQGANVIADVSPTNSSQFFRLVYP
jgi:hypothetical protein